jgi:glucose-1-phosphate thymidylyltransferase
MSNAYMGAILAAGRGSRMGRLGEDIPKALLPIGNRHLIEYQIEQMRDLGLGEIAVLIGHRGYQITKVLGDGERLGVRLHYVEQTKTAGIAYALGLLEPVLDRPFMLMLGDIFFTPLDLRDMMTTFEHHDCRAVLATKTEDNALAIRKNFAILQDEGGRVQRVIEKPRHVPNRHKGVGLYLFDPVIFDAIRRTPRTALRDEYELTHAIQVMIEDAHPVRASDCIADDVNLTFLSDLLLCNLRVIASLRNQNLVDPSARLHPHAVMDRAVVGRGAVVEKAITVRRSVILADSIVSTGQDLDGFVISPYEMIDCRAEIAQWPDLLGPCSAAANPQSCPYSRSTRA